MEAVCMSMFLFRSMLREEEWFRLVKSEVMRMSGDLCSYR
jgi:hypothetical protein